MALTDVFRTQDSYSSTPRRGGRLGFALVVVVLSLISYFGMRSENPLTGETQYVALDYDQEIALGLQSAPHMAAQHGGVLNDGAAQQAIDRVGAKLLKSSGAEKLPYHFDFHLLADSETINAFALPGGQVFLTAALYRQLENEDQLAAVLGHEIGHVLERHAAQQLAKAQLTQGLAGAAVIASSDPDRPGAANAQVAAIVAQLVTLRYGRKDELESDRWGVKLARAAGYDPRGMVGLLHLLERSARGGSPPEFFSTHPNPEHRIALIERYINEADS